jgi:hypothetical protein
MPVGIVGNSTWQSTVTYPIWSLNQTIVPWLFQTFHNHPNSCSISSSYSNIFGKLFIDFDLHFPEHSSRWWDFFLALWVEWLVDLWIFSICYHIEPFKWSLDIVVCSHGAYISKTSHGNVSILFKKVLLSFWLTALFSRWRRFQYWRNTRIGAQSTRTNRNDQQNLVNEEPNVEDQTNRRQTP